MQDYRAKVLREAALLEQETVLSGQPQPLGDPASGVIFVMETPSSAQMEEAILKSLEALGLENAYLTWAQPDLLLRELLCMEPPALIAVGPGAAGRIVQTGYTLAQRDFSEAPEGEWFAWTKGIYGLRLPSLISALEDEDAKRSFWKTFQKLRLLHP